MIGPRSESTKAVASLTHSVPSPPSGQDDRSTIPAVRELFKQQHYYQNLTKHTYLKGRYDVITSVAIPLALAASSMFMIGRGVYNMSHGIGKKE
ncbi:unnamed protein product [Miscanthus lutarioriparius]|uniref:COX VIIa-like protein n=1 Tax=Miscanthus lutarioriparius TaxID=422564 RepID=A0A811NDE2_9POAL|nr:unnamed protein product [Miscanthus lutarioriparius]